jgi:hypothetical protein
MPDENSAGASYLAALKQANPKPATPGESTPKAAAIAPARTLDSILSPPNRSASTPSPGNAQSNPSDKRKNPRYRCQGSAHLTDLRTSVATWATFTDVSLQGCYVEAMSTFPVGSPLALTIEVNGFRVESRGEVRVVYPNLGMGLLFTTMSSADRKHLDELLQSLPQSSVHLASRDGAHSSTPPNASALANPAAALKALADFFDERLILSREEFQRILKKSQNPL